MKNGKHEPKPEEKPLTPEQLRQWLDRRPPKGTWRERFPPEQQEQPERDEQLEAGHG